MSIPAPFYLCGFCEKAPANPSSHAVEAYMGRWAKRMSATGHFREQGAPSRPVQDLPTIPLLCLGCEQTFKAWEDDFRVNVFEPWSARLEAADPSVLPEDVQLPQGSWLSPYVRSLCWRALHYTNERGVRNMNLTPMAQAAHEAWRPGSTTSSGRSDPRSASSATTTRASTGRSMASRESA